MRNKNLVAGTTTWYLAASLLIFAVSRVAQASPFPCNYIALQARNGQYVVAEGGGGREVNANRNAIGPWEIFHVVPLGGTEVALQANNGQFVVAEDGGGREVNANRNAIGPWERLNVIRLWPPQDDAVALQVHNDQFVVAEDGGGREVNANRDFLGPWETFIYYCVSP